MRPQTHSAIPASNWIRTNEPASRLHVFKTCAINQTLPYLQNNMRGENRTPNLNQCGTDLQSAATEPIVASRIWVVSKYDYFHNIYLYLYNICSKIWACILCNHVDCIALPIKLYRWIICMHWDYVLTSEIFLALLFLQLSTVYWLLTHTVISIAAIFIQDALPVWYWVTQQFSFPLQCLAVKFR